MSEKTFYLNSSFEAKSYSESKKTLKIAGYANTITKDRTGDVVTAEAWAKGIENFRRNPIMLFQHKHEWPIGRFDKITVDKKGIFVEGTISESAEKNHGVHTLIKDGALKSFSVGFRVKDGKYNHATDTMVINDVELLEISIVSVPANQESLFSIRKSFDTSEDYKSFVEAFKEEKTDEEEFVQVDPNEPIPFINLLGKSISETEPDQLTFEEKIQELPEVSTEQNSNSKFLQVDAEGQHCDNIPNVLENTDTNKDTNVSEVAILSTTLHEDSTKENDNMAEQVVDTINLADAKAAAVDTQKDVATASVSAPRVADLVEKTGEAILKEADAQEKRGNYTPRETDERAELQSQILKYKDEIKALQSSKMLYAENSRTSSQFSEKDMANAVLLSKLLNRADVFGTKYGARMKAVTSVDAFLSNFSNNIYTEMEQQLVIAPMFNRITVDAKTFRIPVADEDTDGDVAMFKSGTFATGIADSTNVPTSNQNTLSAVEFTPHKFMATTHLAKDEEEDTVLPLLDFLRNAATRRLARAIDKSLLRGTGALTGFTASPTNSITVGTGYSSVITGITKLADAASLTTATGSSSTKADPTNIAAARTAMGKYGLQLGNDLVYVTSIEGYNNLVTTSDFRTVDKFGPNATYLTGSVGAVYGIPIIVSEYMDAVGVTGNQIGALIYKPGFMIAERRGIEIESEYEPRQQVTAMYLSTRFDFKALTTNASAALDSTKYAYAVNVITG